MERRITDVTIIEYYRRKGLKGVSALVTLDNGKSRKVDISTKTGGMPPYVFSVNGLGANRALPVKATRGAALESAVREYNKRVR